jgi:hypothetical protein
MGLILYFGGTYCLYLQGRRFTPTHYPEGDDRMFPRSVDKDTRLHGVIFQKTIPVIFRDEIYYL